uniref:Rho guanine nucleotide exchange factor 40 n=1 Tax=Anolis carolinensis TaxID=28377 RepID=H9GSS0_ANOCA
MEPEPVEECVQSTLAALYPPFEATAPTLLSQVFEVLERTYQHDALRYTLDFLVPAKHILARIQSEACAQYSGFVFCHEGWPLCLREKILVQLGSLPWQRLCPGDFYLQVVPHRECAPRLVLKCLSPEGHRGVQELPVPPDSYPFLFTVEWLNGINKERRVGRLERCLLAAGEKVLSLPWPELVYPQFVHKDGFIVGQRCPVDLSPEVLGARSPGDGRHSGGENRESEGEYVHLLEVSPTLHQAPRIPQPCGTQIQTMPARKGHSKSRNRRHRAWLHHKSGCGENFALRQAAKAQEAEKSSQESSTLGDRIDQMRGGGLSLALGQMSEASKTARSLSPGQPEQNKGLHANKAQPNIFGSATNTAELGKAELPGSGHQNPVRSREESIENQSPVMATPKRAAKGNRRKKKGAGRGAGGGRTKQGVSVDAKEAKKEVVCVSPGEQDSGKREDNVSTIEQAVSSEEGCVEVVNSNVPPEKNDNAEDKSFDVGKEGAGPRECSVGSREPESGMEKCSADMGDSSANTEDRTVIQESQGLSTEEVDIAIDPGQPRVGTVEQDLGTIEQGADNFEGHCLVEKDPIVGANESNFATLQKENEPSIDGKEEPLSIEADPRPEKTENSSPSSTVHLGQSVNWALLESGVFALTGGMDKAGHSLLMIVPQPLQDELPPGQEDLVNTLRYMHSLLRQELKALGLTVLLDLSQVDDWAFQAPVLLPGLHTFQESSPPPISQLLVVLPPDDRFVPHEEELALEPAVAVRLLPLSELSHHVALDQLTPALGGTMHYSPLKWVAEHQALEQLQELCRSVLQAVCEASAHLKAVGTASSQEEVSAQITLHQETMRKLLSEPRLLELQRRGGSLLARLPPLGPCR